MACKGCSVQIEKIGVMYLYTIGKKKNYLNLPASLWRVCCPIASPRSFEFILTFVLSSLEVVSSIYV